MRSVLSEAFLYTKDRWISSPYASKWSFRIGLSSAVQCCLSLLRRLILMPTYKHLPRTQKQYSPGVSSTCSGELYPSGTLFLDNSDTMSDTAQPLAFACHEILVIFGLAKVHAVQTFSFLVEISFPA